MDAQTTPDYGIDVVNTVAAEAEYQQIEDEKRQLQDNILLIQASRILNEGIEPNRQITANQWKEISRIYSFVPTKPVNSDFVKQWNEDMILLAEKKRVVQQLLTLLTTMQSQKLQYFTFDNGKKISLKEATETTKRQLAGFLVFQNGLIEEYSSEQVIELPSVLAEYVTLSPELTKLVALTTSILASQFDVKEKTEIPERHDVVLNEAQEILQVMLQKNLQLKDILLPCLNENGELKLDEQTYTTILDTTLGIRLPGIGTAQSEQVNALKLLVGFLKKNTLQHDNTGEVYIHTALEQATKYSTIHKLQESFKDITLKIISSDLDGALDSSLEKANEAIPEKLMNEFLFETFRDDTFFESLNDQELKNTINELCSELLADSLTVGATVKNLNDTTSPQLQNKYRTKMKQMMIDEVCKPENADVFRASLLIPKDTKGQRDLKAIVLWQELLSKDSSTLRTKDVAKLYFLFKTNTTPEGVVQPNFLLGLTGINLIAIEKENAEVVRTLKIDAANRLYTVMKSAVLTTVFSYIYKSDPVKVVEEAVAKLELPDEQKAELLNMYKLLIQMIQDEISKNYKNFFDLPLELQISILWKYVALAAGVLTTSGFIAIGFKAFRDYTKNQKLSKQLGNDVNRLDDLDKNLRNNKITELEYNTQKQAILRKWNCLEDDLRTAARDLNDNYNHHEGAKGLFRKFERHKIRKEGNRMRNKIFDKQAGPVLTPEKFLQDSFIDSSNVRGHASRLIKNFPTEHKRVIEVLEPFFTDTNELINILREAGLKDDVILTTLKQFPERALHLEKIDLIKSLHLQILDELTQRDGQPSRASMRSSAEAAMAQLDALESTMPSLRRTLAETVFQKVVGSNVQMTDEIYTSIHVAHLEPDLTKKVQMLQEVCMKKMKLTPDQAKQASRALVRTGVTGSLSIASPRALLNAPDVLQIMIRDGSDLTDLVKRAANTVDSATSAATFTHTLEHAEVQKLANELRVTNEVNQLVESSRLAANTMKRLPARYIEELLPASKLGKGLLVFGLLVELYDIHLTRIEMMNAEEAGELERARILQGKLQSKKTECAVGTVGIPAAFAVSGPVGWVAAAGLVAKSITADRYYDYAIELNDITIEKYRHKSPEELITIMQGQQDWMFEQEAPQEARFSTALQAYIAKTQRIQLDDFDYQGITTQLSSPSNTKSFGELESLALQNKIVQQSSRIQRFIHTTKQRRSASEPFAVQFEQAEQFAELARMYYMAPLGTPERKSLIQFLQGIGITDQVVLQKEMIEPADLLDTNGKSTNVLSLYQYHKIRQLQLKLAMYKTLEAESDSPDFEKLQFTTTLAREILGHDVVVFMAPTHNQTKFDAFPRQWTIGQILTFEFSKLADLSTEMKPQEFATEVETMKTRIRSFLAKNEPFDPVTQDGPVSHYGPYKPRWSIDK